MDKSLILIGLRGSGKTTIAKKLSRFLKWPYIETDDYIANSAGMKISELIISKGIRNFRKLERQAVIDAIKHNPAVIATGGGVVENPENMNLLKKKGRIIYLKGDPAILAGRIGNDQNRPLLTSSNNMKEDLINLYHKRKKLYRNWADLIIEVNNQNPSKTIKKIMEKIC
ncbi:hypothetical protein A2W14_01830 [Candidatus Gottesmanbacteria bacterium RBG_16_37_8]|uniref:Shikimate kinase n=1 Tax=Candidatus Gottesmanbacteria bacterium RBG_16_37_8 TaxID=1798371 RepID=A0A1F5YUK8_9BACT|nr:MAG: hypothetical protein A2W14_01830 [Candidatus Gottesmanbacteria bacterium RBG_16_37_8]